MSEQYFCIFCDTVMLALDQLRPHMTQHLTEDDDDLGSEELLTEEEMQFIDKFMEYEKRLNYSINLYPKALPKDSVKELLIGCPACDAIIRCFDLVPNKQMDKQVCHCGQTSNRCSAYSCDQCYQMTHYSCARSIGANNSIDSKIMKCLNCWSKDFEMSYLKCKEMDEQMKHCYQHLNYFPYTCEFSVGDMDEICGQKLFEFKALEPHLESEHNYRVDSRKDICDELSTHFVLKQIHKIQTLIDTHLNSKSKPQLVGNAGITITPIGPKPILPVGDDNSFMKGIGLYENQWNDRSDSKTDFSFQYSSQAIVKRVNKSLYQKNKKWVSDEYCAETSSSFDNSLDSTTFSGTPTKRPNHSLVSRRRSYENETFSTVSAAEELPAYEDSNILSHKRDYRNWFNQTKRTKFPYFPQKDDDLYYLPYGHELYREEVFRQHLYCTANKHNAMKFYKFDKILAKVAKIDFLFRVRRKDQTVIRCVYITLRPYDKKYGTICHVKYHDMAGVVDFLILKEHYESSLEVEWDIGDEFQSVIGNKYWFGVIVGINSADYCQQTSFKKYQIKWYSTDEIDWLSPWDMEPLRNNVAINKRSYLPVTELDRQSFFQSLSEEWPQYNERKELDRIAKGLKIILEMDKMKEFSILSDITDSRYKDKILYPVDMKTFISRVENRYYRRHLAIKYDIKFLEANIRKLIKSVKRDPEYRFDEAIGKRLKYHTKFVTALCLLFIDTLDCTNPYELYHNIDDYIETHDVKCYSAKRVHMNKVKKHPNILPVPQKRQSFSTAKKTFKMFNALKNTRLLSHKSKPKVLSTAVVAPKKSSLVMSKLKAKYRSKPRIETQFNPNSTLASVRMRASVEPNQCTGHGMVLPSDSYSQNMYEQFDSEDGIGFAADSNGPPVDYSSDVSVSENNNNEYDYNDCLEESDYVVDSDADPDYKTTNYYKNKV